ncbi:MAG: DUF4294 domain-containing protein [Bacteroidetes bacterium]|nr:DUF4294 domain-containing protein [Flavobacteriales bacterium]NOG57199.1 DUF4294 domain-containing protein [Bacteroidota bacterium]
MNTSRIVFLVLFFFTVHLLVAQKVNDSTYTTRTVVFEGDTIPYFAFEPIPIFTPKVFKNKREERKYGRLKRYVVKVYPYAEVAGEMLRYFDDTLKTIKSEARRKKYLKKVEEELKQEFTGELKKLTILQGIILVKLIDRETGNTSYDLIKQLRGSFSAFLWQSLARLFGSNLKLEYDPTGEDRLIEEIVQKIELGLIPYEKRERKKK